VEIEQIHGWFANIYPWRCFERFRRFSVRALWGRPNDYQSGADIAVQNQLLAEYGSGADVLGSRTRPADHNQWLRTYFATAAVRSSSRDMCLARG
jgi:hypothetical protein